MKNKLLSAFLFMTSLTLSACEDVADKYKENIFVPQEPSTEYTADYDDGENIYINVKIAIDKKGWESQSPEFFRTKLEDQWKLINARFNNCGQKGDVKLTRKYVYKPDLDDIIVYDGCSYWGENGADSKVLAKLDKNIFKLMVIYDFFYEGGENGEYGGGCGDSNGIGTILVINASEDARDKYNNHFDDNTYRAITHELGHFRGVIDLYAEVIDGTQNPVNGESYMPISCLMNNMTYTPDAESVWSDYAVKIINKAGNIKLAGMINEYMYEDFADKLVFKVTQNGVPADATIKLYPQAGSYKNEISSAVAYQYSVTNGSIEMDARPVFFKNPDYKWDRTAIYLVEASYGEVKKYVWLADYMLHNSGIDGEKTYTVNFEF